MSTSRTDEQSAFPVWGIAVPVLALAAVAGAYLLAGSRVEPEGPMAGDAPGVAAAASVEGAVLTAEELALADPGGDGRQAALAWTEDELLARLAVDEGLDDPVLGGFVARRAVQLLRRDLLLSRELSQIAAPTMGEVRSLMRQDSLLYSVERHYFEMLVPDSATAESLRARVAAGQSFQVLAENASLAQRSAIGGDMGFLVGGELTGRGLPAGIGTLTGLSDVVGSDTGWRIFLVTETRALTDTARVAASLSEVILRGRRAAVVDSLLEVARSRYEVGAAVGGGER